MSRGFQFQTPVSSLMLRRGSEMVRPND
jgi:hypothetical protein